GDVRGGDPVFALDASEGIGGGPGERVVEGIVARALDRRADLVAAFHFHGPHRAKVIEQRALIRDVVGDAYDALLADCVDRSEELRDPRVHLGGRVEAPGRLGDGEDALRRRARLGGQARDRVGQADHAGHDARRSRTAFWYIST